MLDPLHEEEQNLTPQRLERIRMMTSPPSLIESAVLKACGSPLQTLTRITDGFSNEVYRATTIGGEGVIVRIHWWSNTYFKEEQWALKQCAAHAIPTPRFLLLEYTGSGDDARSICVETLLPGRTLYSLIGSKSLSPAEAYPLVKAAGALLAQIHAIPAQGWGRINAEGIGPAPSWSDHLTPSLIENAYAAAPKLQLSEQPITDAIALLRSHTALFEKMAPRLLHGDFSAQHILAEGDQVTGCIDFEFSRSGDPAWDFAYWDYFTGVDTFQGPLLPTSWLLEGYWQALPTIDPTFDLRIALWRLELGLELLAYHHNDVIPDYFQFIGKHFLRSLEALA